MTRKSLNRLGRTERYCFVFMGAIAVLLILSQSATYRLLEHAATVPAQLNAAGFQRALSQRAALLAYEGRLKGQTATRDEANAVINRLSDSLKTMSSRSEDGNGQYLSKELNDALARAEVEVEGYVGALRRAISIPNAPLPSSVTTARVLAVLDDVVEIAEGDASQLVADTKTIGFVFSAGTLVALALLGYFLLFRYARSDRLAYYRLESLSDRMQEQYENSPVIQYGFDADGRISKVNRAWEQAFKCPREQAIGRPSSDFLSEMSLQERDRRIAEKPDFGQFSGEVCIYRRSDGTELIGKVYLTQSERNGSNTKEGAGGVDVIVIDETGTAEERRRADRLHALSSEQFENSPLPQFIANREGRIVRANPMMLTTMGAGDMDELVELCDIDLRHLISVEAQRQSRSERPGMLSANNTLFTSSGKAIDVLLYLQARFVDSELIVEGAIIDISELQEVKRQVKSSRERFRKLYDETPVMLCSTDAEGRIVDVNDYMCKQLHIHRDDIIGLALPALMPREHAERYESEHWPAMQSSETVRFETELGMSGDRKYPVKVHARPAMARGRKLNAVQFTIIDITDVVEAEQQRDHIAGRLKTAEKLEAVGQLAAGIAHEINTPCQYVSDNLAFLRQGVEEIVPALQSMNKPSGSDAVTAIDVDLYAGELPDAIEQSIQGMAQIKSIVLAMKDFSHPGGDQQDAVDINRLVESVATVSKNEWKYRATLELDLDPDVGEIRCAGSSINQVVLNMIVNAAHAIEDNHQDGSLGRIVVRTRRRGQRVEILIEDDGCGIPQEHLSSIFNPFFTTKQVGKGTGQGLAIAHRIVTEEHDGTLDVETVAGKGTTFRIGLPDMPQENVA